MSRLLLPVCASVPVVMTIAGSDSGGGAGIQADLKTFAALGCHGVSAITALTAQNTRRVASIAVTSIGMLRDQIDVLFEDFEIAAVKIGMLGNAEVIREVVAAVKSHAPRNVVVDPVMVATSGDRLLSAGAVDWLRTELLPLADLLTPNLPEAEWLLKRSVGPDEFADAGRALLAMGARAVLLKGGHLLQGEEVRDVLADAEGELQFLHARLPLQAHGTGCTLASACAAYLSRGHSMRESAKSATDYVHAALRHAFIPGRSDVAVLNHFAAGRAVA